MEQWFAGKVALITGGGDGIGRAAALLFARRGAKVAILDINGERGGKVVEEISAENGEAFNLVCDVSSSPSVQEAVQTVIDRFGRLDCAFNNAAINHPLDYTWDDRAFKTTLDVNVVGVMNCLKFEIPEMIRAGGGTIVNTSSVGGLVGSTEIPSPAYTTSKHAVIGLTRAAAMQYCRNNIRINALCPGVTETRMVQQVADQSEVARTKLQNFAPIGRMARPEEIAEAAIWLASDKSSYVMGHALVVDGGFTTQ